MWFLNPQLILDDYNGGDQTWARFCDIDQQKGADDLDSVKSVLTLLSAFCVARTDVERTIQLHICVRVVRRRCIERVLAKHRSCIDYGAAR